MTEGAGLNLILSKKYGVVGAPAPLMASEVFPQVALAVDRPEWPFLAGDRLASVNLIDAAVPAEISHAGIINPADSGIIVIIERITHSAGAGVEMQLHIGLNVEATDVLGVGNPRDSRWRMTSGTTARTFILTQVGTITSFLLERFRNPVNQNYVYSGAPIVLGPGGFVMVRPTNVNLPVNVNFAWREQLAASGELQGAAT